jgi:hypothetical protein
LASRLISLRMRLSMKRNGMVDERYRKETSETEAPEVATSSESVLQRNCIAGDLQLAESRKQSR